MRLTITLVAVAGVAALAGCAGATAVSSTPATITDAQRVAIINTVADDIVFFAQRPGVGLQDQLAKSAALINAGPVESGGARFNHDFTEWSDIQFAISKSCDANGSGIVISSNTGG